MEAQLAKLNHRKSMFEAEQAITVNLTNNRTGYIAATINYEGGQCPSDTRACQNVVMVAVLLDTFPTPFVDGVDMVYRQLKDILDIIATQQAERSPQHQAAVSISSLSHSKARW
jgi:hypothetical protein